MLKCIKYELKKMLSYKAFLLAFLLTIVAIFVAVQFQVAHNNFNNNIVTQTNYNKYLENVQSIAAQQSTTSIFENDEDSFSSRNIEKTADDLKSLQDIVIESNESRGVQLLTGFNFVDIISVIFIIILCYFIFFYEKENKLYQLIKCTPNGNSITFLSKTITVILLGIIYQAISFIVLIFPSIKFGLGNLTASIQSVPSFMECDIKCNILSMLIIYYTFRILGFLTTATIFSVIALKTSNSIIYVFCSLLFSAVNILFFYINPQSSFSFLKYVNFTNIINPIEYLSHYRNINMFGYPISYKLLMFAFLLLFIFVFVFIGLSIFVKSELTAKKVKIKKTLNRIKACNNIKSIFIFELYKSSFINKGAILLIAFIIFESIMLINTNYYKSPQEHYYKNYMDILSGEITPEKIVYIETEKQNIINSEKMQEELNEKYNNGEISLLQFQSELKKNIVSESRRNAFDQVLKQYDRISKQKNAHFVYDTGYKKIFNIGEENRMFGVVDLIVLFLLIILFSAGQLPLERKSKMDIILNTTPNGTSKTNKIKLEILTLFTSSFFLIKYIFELLIILNNYGLKGILFPAGSIIDNISNENILILYVLVFKLILAYLMCICISFAVYFLINKILKLK